MNSADDWTSGPTRPVGMTVWIDFWQMQCCGEPFALGTQVAWTHRGDERFVGYLVRVATQPDAETR